MNRFKCLLFFVMLGVLTSGCKEDDPAAALSGAKLAPAEKLDGTKNIGGKETDASQSGNSTKKNVGLIAQPKTQDSGVPSANNVRPDAEDLSAQFPKLAALPPVPVPGDNPISPEKVELGKLLFFDNRLSGDAGTSCASCHDPRLGWGDGQGVSRGYAGTQHWRNSQTTVNSAYFTKLFWAGESTSLEAQAESAITGNLAGNGDESMIEERLAQIPQYVDRFKAAFGVERPTFDYVLKAIAAFERVDLISNDSPFDKYLEGDEHAISDEAKLGLILFTGKARCIVCHNGALMSDENYHFLDLPENKLFESDPLRQISLRYQHYIRGVQEEVYRSANTDLGLYYTTKRDEDKGKFRTPSLRYIAYTAPYMHNGVFGSLEQVVDFYDQGGGADKKQSPLIKPLNLTDDEKFNLIEFLLSLSGPEIRIATPELPPYEVIDPDDE